MITSTAVPACAICNKPVPLEIAKADEDGQSVHEQCYVLRLQLERSATEPAAWKWPKASAATLWTDA